MVDDGSAPLEDLPPPRAREPLVSAITVRRSAPPPTPIRRDSTSAPRPAGLGGMPLQSVSLGRVGEAPAITPQMTAIFGGLFGLATVASIVALLIQIFPVEDQRTLAARAAAAGSSETAPRDEAAPRPEPKKRERHLLPGPWRVSALKGTHLVVSGKMERRSFIKALTEAGVPKAEVYRILKSMDGVRKFDKTGRSESFTVAMERGTKKVTAFEYAVGKSEIYQSKTDENGLLKGERLDMKLGEEEYATSFYVGADFARSYASAGLEPGLTQAIDEALNGRTSHEAFEEGGVVRIVVVEQTALGAFVGYERIKAIEYRPVDPSKETLRAYWFDGEATHGYVDEKGRHPSNKGWRTPCPGAPITSHFNPKRMNPVLHVVMPHQGTDFGAPIGTPVYAAYRGTVAIIGAHGASGNLVAIDHPGGVQTGYAHLSRFAPGLKIGDKVGTRQLIGYVGNTGRSTGPHLHFSAKRDGKFFDPLELKLDSLALLPVTERAAFLEQKGILDAAIEAIPLAEPPEPEPVAEPAADADSSSGDSSSGDGDKDDSSESDESADEAADKPAHDADTGKGKGKGDKGKGDSDKPDGEEEDLQGDDLSGKLE